MEGVIVTHSTYISAISVPIFGVGCDREAEGSL
jgi:hypothetical protein